jgi:hypothetical protein
MSVYRDTLAALVALPSNGHGIRAVDVAYLVGHRSDEAAVFRYLKTLEINGYALRTRHYETLWEPDLNEPADWSFEPTVAGRYAILAGKDL